ncbi:hypothetical protein ACFL3Q_06435 [Planctomycetota bacterium]
MKLIKKIHINSFLLNIIIIFSICLSISCQNSDNSNELVSVPIVFNEELEDGHFDADACITVIIDSIALNLFLDTGNPGASIDLTTKTLKKIEVTYTGETKKTWDYKADEFEGREYILPRVKIGDLEFTNIHATEHKMQRFSDGTISFKFLQNYNVLIDFPNRNMRLYKLGYLPKYLRHQSWTPVNAFDRGGFTLSLKMDGIEEDFIFALDNAAIALDDEQKPYGMIRLKSSFGDYLEKNDLIIPKEDDPAIVGIFNTSDLKLHGIKIPNLDFMVVDYKYPERDGLLGYNFFIKHPMFIDFKNDMLYVKFE